jgi:hypothetical protein
MYLLYWRNPKTGNWHLYHNSHTGSLSGLKRYGRPGRSMRWGDVARDIKRDFARKGIKVKLVKKG